MTVRKFTPRFFRIALMMVGGILATVGLILYELHSGIPPNFPNPYHFIGRLLESFLSGIFSVWLFFTPEFISSSKNRSLLWVQKGAAAAALTCFVTSGLWGMNSDWFSFALEQDTVLSTVAAVAKQLKFILEAFIIWGTASLWNVGTLAMAIPIGAACGYVSKSLADRILLPSVSEGANPDHTT
jgi:hypothetical protein